MLPDPEAPEAALPPRDTVPAAKSMENRLRAPLAAGLAKETVPPVGPETIDQRVETAPGEVGRPSSETVPSRKAVSGLSYQVVDNGLVFGARAYTDRPYTYNNLPAMVQGATYVMTPNNDKSRTSDPFLTFTVNVPVTVYVAYDVRATALPGWMSGWANTGQALGTSDVGHDLFSMDFVAGAVSLGGNKSSGALGAGSNYTVVVVPN